VGTSPRGFRQVSTKFHHVGGIWWNLIKSAELSGKRWITADNRGQLQTVADSYEQFHTVICRVFHRDIPTVTGLVPLQIDLR